MNGYTKVIHKKEKRIQVEACVLPTIDPETIARLNEATAPSNNTKSRLGIKCPGLPKLELNGILSRKDPLK